MLINGDTLLTLNKPQALFVANKFIQFKEVSARYELSKTKYDVMEYLYKETLSTELILLRDVENEKKQKEACFTQLENSEVELNRVSELYLKEKRTAFVKGGALGIVIGMVGTAILIRSNQH